MSDKLTPHEKRVKKKFREFLMALDCFKNDHELQDETAERVSKMYCREIFAGLNTEMPKMKLESTEYRDIVVQSNIGVNTVCQHHFLPVLCTVTIAYLPTSGLIGLSKLNRIAKWAGARPCLQEALTNKIHSEVTRNTGSKSVAVFVNGVHMCVKMRGIKDHDSVMKTRKLTGIFYFGNSKNVYENLIDIIRQ